jgi:hypothetical protein
VFNGGEQLEVTRSESMFETTRSMTQLVEVELERALDRNAKNINIENCDTIFQYKVYKTRITWVMRCCEVCMKPNIMHEDPWSEECVQLPINQNLLGEYIEQLENHDKIKQIARRLEPRKARSRVNKSQSQEKCNFSHWKKIEETRPQYQEDLEDEYKDPEDGYEDITEVKNKVKNKFEREFSEEEMEEGRCRLRQIDDYLSQNPTERRREEWTMRLHPDDLENS